MRRCSTFYKAPTRLPPTLRAGTALRSNVHSGTSESQFKIAERGPKSLSIFDTLPSCSDAEAREPALVPHLAQYGTKKAPHQPNYLSLQLSHEGDEIVLFLGSEFEFKDEVEELHCILQGQKPVSGAILA